MHLRARARKRGRTSKIDFAGRSASRSDGARDDRIERDLHGSRKNACCYHLECGLNDIEVGEILGMSPETVRPTGNARADDRQRCVGPLS